MPARNHSFNIAVATGKCVLKSSAPNALCVCVCVCVVSPSFGVSRSFPKSFRQPLPKDCHRQRTLLSPFHGCVTENSVL